MFSSSSEETTDAQRKKAAAEAARAAAKKKKDDAAMSPHAHLATKAGGLKAISKMINKIPPSPKKTTKAVEEPKVLSEATDAAAPAAAAAAAKPKEKDKMKPPYDPDHPKRPANAHMLFANDMRAAVVKEHPEMSMVERGKVLGEKWRAIGEKDKARYETKAAAEKERYAEEMKHYVPPVVESDDDDDDDTATTTPEKDADADAPAAKGGKKKKKKDPNAPKRPPNAYILFSNDARAKLQKQHPEMSPKEIMSTLAAQWQNASEKEKAKYEAKTKEAKEAYDVASAEYEKNKPAAASDDDDDDDDDAAAGKKGGKKRKQKKDPNAPKRPLSAYILFSGDARAKVVKENPEMKATEIIAAIGAKWKAIGAKDKAKYEAKATAAKEKYDEEKKSYEASKAAGTESESEEPAEKPAKKGKKAPETESESTAKPSKTKTKKAKK